MLFIFFLYPILSIYSLPLEAYRRTETMQFKDHFNLVNASYISFDEEYFLKLAQDKLEPKIEKYAIFFATAEWLESKQRYLVTARVSIGIFTQSFILITYFDKNWNQIVSKSRFSYYILPTLLPISVPDYKLDWAGPEDPRMFKSKNNDFLIVFNMLDNDLKRKMMLYSLNTTRLYKLQLEKYPTIFEGNSFITQFPNKEKNWVPLITDEKILFVYSLDDFQLIDCTSKALCTHVQGNYSHNIESLKPGSPFVRYDNTNYYFSFAFKHIYCYENVISPRSYRPVFTILYVNEEKEQYHVFFQSELDYFFDQVAYKPYTDKDPPGNVDQLEICQRERVLIIPKIVRFDLVNDETEVLGFFNDNTTFVATINGIARFVANKIEIAEGKYYNLFS